MLRYELYHPHIAHIWELCLSLSPLPSLLFILLLLYFPKQAGLCRRGCISRNIVQHSHAYLPSTFFFNFPRRQVHVSVHTNTLEMLLVVCFLTLTYFFCLCSYGAYTPEQISQQISCSLYFEKPYLRFYSIVLGNIPTSCDSVMGMRLQADTQHFNFQSNITTSSMISVLYNSYTDNTQWLTETNIFVHSNLLCGCKIDKKNVLVILCPEKGNKTKSAF